MNKLGNYANTKTNNTHYENNGIVYYYSYKTKIAVRNGSKLAIRENSWGPTTGKHLNAIDRDKSIRLPL
ncbi:MAG: hypothetical protein DRI98_11840, partial [Bacteroidetes bacterium]